MKKQLVMWVERYFYAPRVFEKIISFLLLPITTIYCIIVYSRYILSTSKDLGVKVISVGNLTVGGSGKTPLVIALAKRFTNVAIVLRGYGRNSKGLVVVKDKTQILCDVFTSGDEAMIYAKKVSNAIVIVSEDRKAGIKKAKEFGVDIVFLDDGYSKHSIKKLDFVIEVETPNNFCLPSGAYREHAWRGKKIIFFKENRDFVRHSFLKNPTKKMCLVTAIARPQRLDAYLPEVCNKYYFEDHHIFSYEELAEIWEKEQPTSFLVTLKDYVKMEQFGFPLSLLDLELEVKEDVFLYVEEYIQQN